MTELVAKKAFLAGLACRTQGWYVQHAPPEIPGPGLQWRFWIGADVQARARRWLGAGTMLRRTPVDAAAKEAREAVADLADTMFFEATFTWNGCVVRADAIRRHGAEWDLIEIKSGKSPDDGEKVKDEYLDDIACTCMVARGAGLRVSRSFMLLVNRNYRLNGSTEMFALVDVTDLVKERSAALATVADDVAMKVASDERPEPELIFDCRKCDYFDTECVGKGIVDPLFVIPRISEKKFQALKAYERISRLPADADLTPIQRGVVDVIQSGIPNVDYEGLGMLDQLRWPVRYLDFETVSPHLPWFEGVAPYEAMPFQYSLHVLDAPGGAVRHVEYLAPVEGDWRRLMTEKLLHDLGLEGSIVVYSGYEKGRLRALAETFPDLASKLNAAVERLFDLEQLFKKGYQHPGFGGRTSIKKVLPVMVPELSYHPLAVSNGDDALGVFGLMRVGVTEAEFVPARREALLNYCKLDTYAMVQLHAATEQIRGR